jgi:hypothetical protein
MVPVTNAGSLLKPALKLTTSRSFSARNERAIAIRYTASSKVVFPWALAPKKITTPGGKLSSNSVKFRKLVKFKRER